MNDRAISEKNPARALLDQFDDLWCASLSTVIDNARSKARRDGHKYRVIDREGLRAALIYLAKEMDHHE